MNDLMWITFRQVENAIAVSIYESYIDLILDYKQLNLSSNRDII